MVDTDCGLDDALALLYLAAHPAEAELAAVTTVHGNAPVGSVVANVGHVLAAAGIPEVPVGVGAAGPLGGPPLLLAPGTHGADGLGDLVVRTPPSVVARPAAERLVELARARPGHYDLLALGPLTNVALALRLEPELLTLFRSVVVMGGPGPDETNVRRDPSAAARVLGAPANRLVTVGVDVTATVLVDPADLRDGFAAALAARYASLRGRRLTPVHDAVAAALLVHPDWFTVSDAGAVTDVDRAAFLTDLAAMDFG
ncbi:nucleoside hydrolase [Jiangella anatolica]|uniref:nucleoside hydrolase n=1 Tax=Jiangella anatolica TaxID=2670374 RepID=UPI0013143514|nr:nucleoside hydrolase [Jiangella anatolica]